MNNKAAADFLRKENLDSLLSEPITYTCQTCGKEVQTSIASLKGADSLMGWYWRGGHTYCEAERTTEVSEEDKRTDAETTLKLGLPMERLRMISEAVRDLN